MHAVTIPRYGRPRMSAIDAIGEAAKRTVFEVLVCMAWADHKLDAEERAAAQAVAMSLGLPETGGALDEAVRHGTRSLDTLPLESLSTRDGELTYLCAAWMSLADHDEARSERKLLEQLRLRLQIAPSRAEWLRAHAAKLRAQSTAPSFWREFETLVVTAARALARGEAR